MSHVLMLCHDQHLDRRVLAQAVSLIGEGHQVTLLALSFGPETSEETMPEGIQLVRIGLKKITPANPTYKGYLKRQRHFNDLLNKLCNAHEAERFLWTSAFRIASRVNWMMYRSLLLLRYRNLLLGDPLPFTSAFVNTGMKFQPDIVEVHDLPALEAGVTLAEEWRVPLVYDAHELYPEQCSFSAVQRRICSQCEARLIPKAKLIFAVNESIADEMAKRYHIKKPVTLINAIDCPDGFDPQVKKDVLREKLSLAPHCHIVLFQGGFAPHRNLEKLIDAMRLVKTEDLHLVMLGFGDYGVALKARGDKLGLIDRHVHFLSAVPLSELLQHSASADVGIIPYPHVDLNSYYCTPNKLFEFIQAGLPILANDSPELRRYVAAEGFGLVRPMNSARQIAAALDEIFAGQDLSIWRENLIGKRTRFAWQIQHRVYLDAMSPLLCKADKRHMSLHMSLKEGLT